MFPEMTPDAALYNLYLDFVRFFDNSDGAIDLACLVRKVKHAFEKTPEQLRAYCDREIRYWSANRPEFILKAGSPCNWGIIANIRKRISYTRISETYNTNLSLKENLINGIGVSQSTLYRYCKSEGINTNPDKGLTEAQRRAAKRQDKQERIALFVSLYNPTRSVVENQRIMKASGLELSVGTICTWSKKHCVGIGEADEPVLISPTISIKVPTFDVSSCSTTIKANDTFIDNHSKDLNVFCWNKPDFLWDIS